MNRLITTFFIIASLLLVNSCQKENICPFDIFETEELKTPTELPINNISGTNTLYVNSERIIETPGGYHIKGTIFSDSEHEIIPVTSGDFLIATSSLNTAKSATIGLTEIKTSQNSFDFSGYGTAEFPSVGLLSQFVTDEVSGSDINYNTGAYFKEEADFSRLPLEDNLFYFHYVIDQTAEKTSKDKNQKIKNTAFTFKDFFMDARDPAVFFLGDISTNGKPMVTNLGIGISAGSNFTFEPFSYGENLEEIVGGTGFTTFNGPLFIGGDIPIRKYPLKIVGSAIINTGFSSAGVTDLFERGFDVASFQMGVNGHLTFDRSLIDFLPLNLDVSLGNATLEARYTDSEAILKFAGEYSQIDYLTEILGAETIKYLPVNASEGRIYASIGSDFQDYKLYFETSLSVNVPGWGIQPLSQAIVLISPAGIELSGNINLPYDIGNVEVKGIINSDGSFMLSGATNSGIRFNENLRYDANISVQISNNGLMLGGDLFLPYGIGAAQFTGEISDRGIGLNGSFSSGIQFSSSVKVNGEMSFTANSWEGIKMQGELTLPAGIADVEVHGEITALGLGLGGSFSSEIDFGAGVKLPAVNISVDASTWNGIILEGGINLPYGLGYASVYGGLTSDIDLYLGGKLGSALDISGVSVFACDMSLDASTKSGVKLNGNVTMPGGLGNISMGGSINSSGFSIYGEKTCDIDFIIVSLNTTFKTTISQSNVNISASGSGCVTVPILWPPWTEELCETVGVDVEPDWGNGSFRLCMDFPVIGSKCIGF